MANFLDQLAALRLEAGDWTVGIAAAAFVIAGAVVFALGWRSRLMMSRFQRVTLLALRVAILLLLTAAMMQVTSEKKERSLSLVFAGDVSQSISNEELGRTSEFLKAAWERKEDIPLRALGFDRSTRGQKDPNVLPSLSRISKNPGTDIERGLSSAYELFPAETFKRLVLFSDGNETTGDALGQALAAKERGVQIDVVELATVTDRDIYIESVNLPRRARPGERIQVSVRVVSNFATKATLALKRGKAIETKREVEIVPGSNVFDFPVTVKTTYSTPYTADVSAEGDDHPDNNALTARLNVAGAPKIQVFSGNPGGDPSLLEALSVNRWSLNGAPIAKFPNSVRSLSGYDLVILSNVDFLNFGEGPAKVLSKYVGEYGGGVLVIGGTNTSRLREKEEDKEKKRKPLPIENLLPVTLKEKKKTEPNPPALLLVIDKSLSMARESKFSMAIRAAKDSIELVPDRGQVGVVLFDDFPRWAVQMQTAKNRDKIIEDLDRFGVDGGTSIYPAMKEGYAALKKLSNKVKHVILLTDGVSISTFDQNAHIIQNMADKKITVSTVALGKESDKKHLQKIAKMGRGRFYYVEKADEIPKIFTKETKTITKTNIVETEFVPELVKRGTMLRGIEFDKMPSLYGYNSARSKPTSELYALAEKKEPMIVRWRFGLGRVSFVGTDSGTDWARQWPDWEQYAKFWSQVAQNTLGDQNRRTYRLDAKVIGENASVTVDALDVNGDFVNDLDLTLLVSAPGSDEPMPVKLKQNRPGGYGGQFQLPEMGEYSFTVKGSSETSAATEGIGRIFLSPPNEFQHQAPNTALLKSLAETTGGRYNPTLDQIFEVPEKTFPRSRPLWPYMLYAALALFLVSIIIRRS
jgi:Ca-activated chloride channel homolog